MKKKTVPIKVTREKFKGYNYNVTDTMRLRRVVLDRPRQFVTPLDMCLYTRTDLQHSFHSVTVTFFIRWGLLRLYILKHFPIN